jgi:hypothetical protein
MYQTILKFTKLGENIFNNTFIIKLPPYTYVPWRDYVDLTTHNSAGGDDTIRSRCFTFNTLWIAILELPAYVNFITSKAFLQNGTLVWTKNNTYIHTYIHSFIHTYIHTNAAKSSFGNSNLVLFAYVMNSRLPHVFFIVYIFI